METKDQPRDQPEAPPLRDAKTPRHDVRDLVGDRNEAVLVHVDQEYRLRITSNGKLILTK